MSGRSLQDLPEHILQDVFLCLSLVDLNACCLVNKYFHCLLNTNVQLLLHQELEAAALIVPPSIFHKTPVRSLLSTLRERQTRFRNLAPAKEFNVQLDRDEWRLYEYLEGKLIRGNGYNPSRQRGLPSGATLYDLTVSSEWETVDPITRSYTFEEAKQMEEDGSDDGEEEEVIIVGNHMDDTAEYKKQRWQAGFEVKDFTMDPGQDLFVVAEMGHDLGRPADQRFRLDIRFLTLSKFEPHPKACVDGDTLEKGVLKGVAYSVTPMMNLTFQVCDDKLFMLTTSNGVLIHVGLGDSRVGAWNWKTGQKLFTHSSGITRTPTGPVLRTIEDLVLITHDIYGIVEYVITPEATELPCRLQLYALEMTDPGAVDATARPGENADPHQTEQYRARNIATFNLPSWRRQAIIMARSDPPPRQFLPVENPLKFYPDPHTGVIILQFDCGLEIAEDEDVPPLYHLFINRETLLSLIPEQSRPPAFEVSGTWPQKTTVAGKRTYDWTELAPYCRFLDDIERQSWVCFVYHYRFVAPRAEHRLNIDEEGVESEGIFVRLFNFDPFEAKRVIARRTPLLKEGKIDWETWQEPVGSDEDVDDVHGMDEDGIYLVTRETEVLDDSNIVGSVKTGGMMPYVWIESSDPRSCHGIMIDDSRIVALTEGERSNTCSLEVLRMGP